jgi:hypothetical protein
VLTIIRDVPIIAKDGNLRATRRFHDWDAEMVSRWLKLAASRFSPPSPVPQSFQVECDCGHRWQGLRLPKSQRLSCSQCGLPVFVLPQCPYPLPMPDKAVGSSVTSEPANGGVGPTVSVPTRPATDSKTLAEEEGSLPVRTAGPAASVSSKAKRAGRRILTESPELAAGSPRSPRDTAPLSAAATAGIPVSRIAKATNRSRRIWQFVAAGVLVLAIGTVLLLVQRSRWEAARRGLDGWIAAGQAALQERQIEAAAVQFRLANNAIQLLGRDDELSQQTRAMSREVDAVLKLHSTGLLELIEALPSRDAAPAVPAARQELVGKWFLFDALTTRSDDADQPSGTWELELPVRWQAQTVLVRIRRADWSINGQSSADGETPPSVRRVFAAAVDEFQVDDTGGLVLALDGDSAVDWIHVETLSVVDAVPDAEDQRSSLLEVLRRQRQEQHR